MPWTHYTPWQAVCVRFLHSSVASFILLFPAPSVSHTSRFSSLTSSPYRLLGNHRSSYQPSCSCQPLHTSPPLPISPFFLILPRSALPVFFSDHCPASPAPCCPPLPPPLPSCLPVPTHLPSYALYPSVSSSAESVAFPKEVIADRPASYLLFVWNWVYCIVLLPPPPLPPCWFKKKMGVSLSVITCPLKSHTAFFSCTHHQGRYTVWIWQIGQVCSVCIVMMGWPLCVHFAGDFLHILLHRTDVWRVHISTLDTCSQLPLMYMHPHTPTHTF